MRAEALRRSAVAVAILLAMPMSGKAQYSPPFPELPPEHLHLSKFVSRELGLELSYPSMYHRSRSPVLPPLSYREHWEVLLYATKGSDQARCADEGECVNFGTMTIALDRRSFNLQAIERYYAHTGWEQPVSFRLDGNTFYWYGAGGGGVTYPDTFLYDLNGHILIIEFDGPYLDGSKSPPEETRGIEKLVLESFRSRGKPRAGS
jgi:hypothetical protein